VEIRRVTAAHKFMFIAIRPAVVERQTDILSLYAGRVARIPFFGKFENLRADAIRWGWKRSALIRVISVLRRYIGLHIYRINVRALVGRSPEPCFQAVSPCESCRLRSG
jgi:hypothetical protein